MLQHTAFTQSAACLSVVLRYSMVLYRLQYHAMLGETLEKKNIFMTHELQLSDYNI